MKVLPPIVTVPVREVVPVFAATLSATVPLPVPAAPLVTAIHVTLLTAVHGHPAAALSVTFNVPPAAVADWLAGEIVGEQDKLNEKLLERALGVVPPGPTALTTTS